MTRNEFDNLCTRYGIAPSVALETAMVAELLLDIRGTKDVSAYNGYRNILIQILETEF